MTDALHNKRMKAEKRFRFYGVAALGFSVLVLVLLMLSLFVHGLPGFMQTQVKLTIPFDEALFELEEGEKLKSVSASAYVVLVRQSLKNTFPDVTEPKDRRALYALVSSVEGWKLKTMLKKNPALLGTQKDIWLTASSLTDAFYKGNVKEETPEANRKITNQQIAWIKELKAEGRIRKAFNTTFFSRGDSRSPERAGFLGAMAGSAFTLLICLAVSFPLGVMTAVYLEEFAKKGRFVDIIEVNINNLAAVPSIIFGLLGLAVYINVMGLPRSASVVGGLTLALMVLPVIIIATRAALKAIPDSIRDAARALGASPLMVVWHHTLPLAMPGIMTGTILSLARAIGETAPLLMIGMVAFVADVPGNFTDPATVMPVQIFLWASSPEGGFAEKTAAGILVLLILLLAMNALAIYLRKRLEVRW
ncbi:MAG: phosphate ABC transporter permease PstA [Rickettsiales bacterium]